MLIPTAMTAEALMSCPVALLIGVLSFTVSASNTVIDYGYGQPMTPVRLGPVAWYSIVMICQLLGVGMASSSRLETSR